MSASVRGQISEYFRHSGAVPFLLQQLEELDARDTNIAAWACDAHVMPSLRVFRGLIPFLAGANIHTVEYWQPSTNAIVDLRACPRLRHLTIVYGIALYADNFEELTGLEVLTLDCTRVQQRRFPCGPIRSSLACTIQPLTVCCQCVSVSVSEM